MGVDKGCDEGAITVFRSLIDVSADILFPLKPRAVHDRSSSLYVMPANCTSRIYAITQIST